MENQIDKFNQDAAIIEASNQVLAAAKSMLGPDITHFTLANILLGASLKAIQEVDGPAGVDVFAKMALEVVNDLSDRPGYN